MDNALGHETLDVYKVAVQLFAETHRLMNGLRGHTAWVIRDQLIRAALSVMLNIAEGNAETHPGERAKFFTYARRSAEECAACLDAACAVDLLRAAAVQDAKSLIKRDIEMLVRMIQRTGAAPALRKPERA